MPGWLDLNAWRAVKYHLFSEFFFGFVVTAGDCKDSCFPDCSQRSAVRAPGWNLSQSVGS